MSAIGGRRFDGLSHGRTSSRDRLGPARPGASRRRPEPPATAGPTPFRGNSGSRPHHRLLPPSPDSLTRIAGARPDGPRVASRPRAQRPSTDRPDHPRQLAS